MGKSLTKTGLAISIIAILFSGCIAKEKTQNTMEIKPQDVSDSVMSAPGSLFVIAGSEKKMTFRSNEIVINYRSAKPEHKIDIITGNRTQTITISNDLACVGNHCQYHRILDGLDYIIEPVTRKGDIWSADTWDTEELYIEVSANSRPEQ